jgi:hypothetical protein
MHKGRPVFASSKYTPALLGRGVRPKLDYDLSGHTPVTMILECYSHAGSFHFYKYSAYLSRMVRADERTRTADLTSLRVIIHVLQGFAQPCKSTISKGFSFLCLALCCTVLRSRWYQSGIR